MRMMAVRLHEGDKLKESIEALVSERHILAASVVSAVGSVSHARLRMAGAQPDKQDIREYNGSFEIVSLIGNLGPGRTHLHMAISDQTGAVFGGHLKEGTIVHTTVELVLAVDNTQQFTEETDKTTGFGELAIKQV